MTLSPPQAHPSPPAPLRTQSATSTRVNASAGKRACAYLIDMVIVAAVAVLVWFFSGSLLLVAVSALELWVAAWIWEGHTGATPGNLICRIRTVQRSSLLTVGAPRLLLRSLLMGLAHIIPVLLPLGLAASGALDGLARARVVDLRLVDASAGSGPSGTPSLETRISAAPMDDASVQNVITRTPLSEARALDAVPAAPLPPEAAVEAPYIPTGAATVPVLQLRDGTVIRVTGLGFIGRAPRAPESIPEAILVRVPDGARSLSRTHASFGIEEGELWVQDLGSANGASVRHLGGGVTELSPQTPFFLVPGDVLVLGGDAELAFRRVVDRSASAADLASAAQAPAMSGMLPPAPAAPETAAPGPAAPSPGASVQERLGADSQPQRRVVAEPIDPEQAPAVAQASRMLAPAIALQFQNGVTVPITGIGYIGRAPTLPEDERADAVLVAVPDGDRSVSRTHGRFGIVGDQAWFEDLGSGNGSLLRTGDGRSGPMTPHQRFSLVPGMTLQLGDCVIRIVAA
ncbi:MAG TPA: FHA domain-containing protein [Microbacterium sp.]|nr:FHA domain-containing protein [Microbacterium sp.]